MTAPTSIPGHNPIFNSKPKTIIESRGLTKKFGDVTAVDNLDLTIEEGEIFGLVGPDGAGKTTTMRLLTAILVPTAGDAWIDGHHIVTAAEPLKEVIAYMPQRFGLYEDLTVAENMDFYADIYCTSKNERASRIKMLLDFTRLAPFSRRLTKNLSGGMKQKLGLACALIHAPKVLFLDEPTNGVDPVSRRDFWNILYQLLQDKVTIFYSTAYLDEAERFRRVGLMHKGKLLRCAAPDVIKREVAAVDGKKGGVATLEEAFISIIAEQEDLPV